MMAAGHVTLLSSFEFVFCSAESCAAIMQFGAKVAPNFIVLGHLLVPELVMKGWDGLTLANTKELFIGTVKVTNFDQMPDCSHWQFVVHGQGAIKANESCLTRLQLADMEVSINCGSDWKAFRVLLKPSQRSNWFEVGLSRSKNTQIFQDAMRSDSCLLAAWLRLLTKTSYLSSCLTFLVELSFWVGSRRVVL